MNELSWHITEPGLYVGLTTCNSQPSTEAGFVTEAELKGAFSLFTLFFNAFKASSTPSTIYEAVGVGVPLIKAPGELMKLIETGNPGNMADLRRDLDELNKKYSKRRKKC